MKRVTMAVTAILATFALSGCGGVYEDFAKQSAFEITLTDGTVAHCVQLTGGNSGDVSVHCKYTDEEATP